MSFTHSIGYSLTEILTFIGAIFVVILGIVTGDSRRRSYYLFALLFIIIITLLEFFISHRSVHVLFYNLFAGDGFSYLFKIVVLISALIFLGTWGSREPFPSYRSQFLFLINLFSVFLLGSSIDLLSLIISLEMFNFSLLLLVTGSDGGQGGFTKARKLYLSRFFSSGIIIIGLIGIVIHTGATRWDLIGRYIATHNRDIYIETSLILLIAGFGFHLSVFPFHYINLDVSSYYKGGKGIYFIVISQLAGTAVLIRMVSCIFLSIDAGGSEPMMNDISNLLAGLGIFTALFLPVQLLRHVHSEKRILFFSSSYSGLILIALSCMNLNSVQAVILFSLCMMPTILLIDYLFFIRNQKMKEGRGYIFRFIHLVVLASFIGLPPLGTFFGKIQMMSALHEKGLFLSEAVLIIHTAFLLFQLFEPMKKEDYSGREETGIINPVGKETFIPLFISIAAVVTLFFSGIFWDFVSRGIHHSLSFVFFNF